jgi:hypothetical protein
MPLRSTLFAGNEKLQACLVSHAAHVVPGAKGDHVALIQSALVRLRALDEPDAKAEARFYGPKTTAAVLAYKRRFGIINRSYQSQADNIVGKMTIAHLDDAIVVLDGEPGMPRTPAPPGPHPKSPPPSAAPPALSSSQQFAPTVLQAKPTVPAGGPAAGAPGTDPFVPPLSALPPDMQDTIRRTNIAKKPDVLLLFPFIAKHEGTLSGVDLSARFAANPKPTKIMTDLHRRMAPFAIWKNIDIIINVFEGIGSRGIFCEPFDHNKFLAQMKALARGPLVKVGPLSTPLMDSLFCQDSFNVHGPRDSFREIVKQGEGLHICITQPAKRATEPCDLHIDNVQQGQVCSDGFCIPLVNGQTIEHLRTVAPWLASEAKKWFPKF